MISKRFFKSKEECEVTFELENDEAKKVDLVASGNNWKPVALKKRKKDGVFYTRVRYPNNSRIEFRYRVDGSTWVNDSEADGLVPNEHGSENSVVDTTPAS